MTHKVSKKFPYIKYFYNPSTCDRVIKASNVDSLTVGHPVVMLLTDQFQLKTQHRNLPCECEPLTHISMWDTLIMAEKRHLIKDNWSFL